VGPTQESTKYVRA